MLKQSIITLGFSIAIAVAANAAAITWGASTDNGFSNDSNAELAIGNYALLGNFNISDSVIQQNANNLAFLQSHFTQFDKATIGEGFSPAFASNFSASTSFDTTATAGLQLYYWVFSSTNNSTQATSFSTATADGIFYFDKTVNPAWALPVEGIAASTTIDITDLTNANGTATVAGAHMVIGSFPSGVSAASGAPNFGLATITTPEPSSAMLIGMGALGLLARRRRNS